MAEPQRRLRGVQGIEAKFCSLLAEELRQDGWTVQREVPVPGGFIDILAEKAGRQMVIEAKVSATRQEVRHALGQLLFYAYHHREAGLFFASPERPSEELIGLLDFYQVGVYPTWQQQRDADDDIDPDPWAIHFVLHDGRTWTTARPEKSYWCPRCGQGKAVHPTVRNTTASELDYEMRHSRVWDVDFSCPDCGHDPYAYPGRRRCMADDSQIKFWTYMLGPWRRVR